MHAHFTYLPFVYVSPSACTPCIVYSTFWVVCPNRLLVIDLVTSLWWLRYSSGVCNEEDWDKVYSDDLRLRMVGTFLYQEETPP